MQARIFEYIRRRKSGKTFKVGVIAGEDIHGSVKIGWSKCNLKAGDRFDVDLGLDIALRRTRGDEQLPPTPKCIQRQVRRFGARCVRYFQDANRVEIPA